jgi:hypothetical protein
MQEFMIHITVILWQMIAGSATVQERLGQKDINLLPVPLPDVLIAALSLLRIAFLPVILTWIIPSLLQMIA